MGIFNLHNLDRKRFKAVELVPLGMWCSLHFLMILMEHQSAPCPVDVSGPTAAVRTRDRSRIHSTRALGPQAWRSAAVRCSLCLPQEGEVCAWSAAVGPVLAAWVF